MKEKLKLWVGAPLVFLFAAIVLYATWTPEATESVIGMAIFLGLVLIWGLNKAANEGWRPPHPKRRCKACGEDIEPPQSAVMKTRYTKDGAMILIPMSEDEDFLHAHCYEEIMRLERFSEESRRITEETRRKESEGKEG